MHVHWFFSCVSYRQELVTADYVVLRGCSLFIGIFYDMCPSHRFVSDEIDFSTEFHRDRKQCIMMHLMPFLIESLLFVTFPFWTHHVGKKVREIHEEAFIKVVSDDERCLVWMSTVV